MDPFIEEYLQETDQEELDLTLHRLLVTTCAFAWNLSVLEHRAEQNPSQAADLLAKARADIKNMLPFTVVENLKRRKVSLFPDDWRFILNVDLVPLAKGGRHLTVASANPEARA